MICRAGTNFIGRKPSEEAVQRTFVGEPHVYDEVLNRCNNCQANKSGQDRGPVADIFYRVSDSG